MKKSSFITTIFIASFSISLAETQPAAPQKAPTHSDILKKRAAILEKKNTKETTQGYTPKVIPPLQKKKKGLIERSTLLAYNGEWTLLPKKAVLHTPDHLKDKIVTTPGKLKIVKWPTFLRKNHGWIHTHPISKEQATAKEKINEEAIKAYKTIGKMVVATYNGKPISIHPNALEPENKKSK